jgi:hypothetical protein
MQIETKYLRLRTAVTLNSQFGDWRVCWLGGWTKHRMFYLVMVVRIKPVIGMAAERTHPEYRSGTEQLGRGASC